MVATIDKRALKELEEELTELANAQFQSDEYKRMFAAPYTKSGAQQFFMQHAQLLLKVAHMYAHTKDACNQVLSGAKQSWAIDRRFRGFLGELLENHAG